MVEAALIGAVGVVIAALVTLFGRRDGKKLDDIHVLVNSRLSEALDTIELLRSMVIAEVLEEALKDEPDV